MKFPTFQTGRDNSKRYVNNYFLFIVYLSIKSHYYDSFYFAKIQKDFNYRVKKTPTKLVMPL